MEQLDLISTIPIPLRQVTFQEKWEQRRPRIASSKASGAVHLDQILPYVQSMRRRRIANIHDPLEQGTILTVSNRGDVVIQWKDAYSASKNYLAVYEGIHPKTRKPIERASWLWAHELEDYTVLGTTFEVEARCGRLTPQAVRERKKLAEAAA